MNQFSVLGSQFSVLKVAWAVVFGAASSHVARFQHRLSLSCLRAGRF